MNNKSKPIHLIQFYLENKISRMLEATALYAFGFYYANYLGNKIDISLILNGYICVLFHLFGMDFLNFVFSDELIYKNQMKKISNVFNPQTFFLILAFSFVGVGYALLSISTNDINLFLPLWMILLIIIGLVSKPARLIYSGYGEILHSFAIAILIPVFAFQLISKIIAPMSFIFLCSAFFLLMISNLFIFENISIEDDIKYFRTTAVMKYGSIVTLNLSVYLITSTYIILLIGSLISLPWRFTVRWFISLPVAVYLIWNINRIIRGKKPNWRMIKFLSISLVLLNAILLIATLNFL